MSVATTAASAQNISTIARPDRFYPPPLRSYLVKIHPFSNSSSSPALFSQARRFGFVQMRMVSCRKASWWQVGALLSGDSVDKSPRRDVSGQLSLDELLSVAEALCIVPPAIYSIGCLVASLLPGVAKPFQWQRMYRVNEKGVNVDLIQRIDKVEQDMRSSVKIVQVLSRQLEKLGIRFRLTRKALKDPISETAALAQKNSDATRALAVQEAVLERELGEIQKVLLAMQEQQQKQLDLILAIGKAGRLLDSKRDSISEQGSIGTSSSAQEKEEAKELEIQSGRHAGGDNVGA
ncbi:uncharacterized protein [Elaeis guineensis]|uniref:uncharacterized protein isoform X3 n=1 Tax=Elaeis guineensis var. tenera TaxID=51953 RepID=UPI003C6DAFA6